ncbi:MAG: FAD-binding oxidoreductase [Candidatus Helarchaeota archaeon]|nr:FAD-binding oxidoreductase [Candidatus Helarchaeota archaeon]
MSIDKTALINDLIDLVGQENVIADEAALRQYGLDRGSREHPPFLVVKPSDPLHFKRLNFILRRYKIDSITPRGTGRGVNLGAYSEDLIIDLSLLNKKLEIDAQNSIVIAQAGIEYSQLQKRLKDKGFRLPIDPLLDGTLGGFIASGGFGYGSFRSGSILNSLRNTTLFLSNGQLIQTGMPNVPPYACGYNLNSVVVGSEGYFGIITEAVLEIAPIAQKSQNLVLELKSDIKISQILIKLTQFPAISHISLYKSIQTPKEDRFQILLRLEGLTLDADRSSLEQIPETTVLDPHLADTLWDNHPIAPAQIPESSAIVEAVVPIKFLPPILKFWERFASTPVFGLLMNPGSLLLYSFLPKDLSESRKNEILTEFVHKAKEFQAFPPTIENSLKEFVVTYYPNLAILRELKPIFDKGSLLKARKLFL